MNHLERATEGLVKVTRQTAIGLQYEGGEIARKWAPERGERYYFQGRRIDHATAKRLGWQD